MTRLRAVPDLQPHHLHATALSREDEGSTVTLSGKDGTMLRAILDSACGSDAPAFLALPIDRPAFLASFGTDRLPDLLAGWQLSTVRPVEPARQPAPSPAPTHARHTAMTQNESVVATRPKGSVPRPHSPIIQLR